jgi:hypothetical protein
MKRLTALFTVFCVEIYVQHTYSSFLSTFYSTMYWLANYADGIISKKQINNICYHFVWWFPWLHYIALNNHFYPLFKSFMCVWDVKKTCSEKYHCTLNTRNYFKLFLFLFIPNISFTQIKHRLSNSCPCFKSRFLIGRGDYVLRVN